MNQMYPLSLSCLNHFGQISIFKDKFHLCLNIKDNRLYAINRTSIRLQLFFFDFFEMPEIMIFYFTNK